MIGISCDTTKLDKQNVMEFTMEELLKLMHNLFFHQRSKIDGKLNKLFTHNLGNMYDFYVTYSNFLNNIPNINIMGKSHARKTLQKFELRLSKGISIMHCLTSLVYIVVIILDATNC